MQTFEKRRTPSRVLRTSIVTVVCSFSLIRTVGEEPVKGFDLGVLAAESEDGAIRLQVSADQDRTAKLVLRAFSSHGGYVLKRGGESDFQFRFATPTNNEVELSILSGSPAKAIFKETVRGSSWAQAVLRASDLAVRKTLKVPGYFAGMITWISDLSGFPEIYVSDLFFTTTRRVTNDGAECLSPNLSPDGRSVLFTSYYPNGFPDIYRVDLDSNRRHPFISFKGSNTGATHSPQGADIALILSGVGNAELYLCDLQGRHIRRLTHSRNAVEADPTWSPDGRTVAFTSDRLGKPQLYHIPSSGGQAERIPTNISGVCAEPAWNPVHPNLIAFTILQGGLFRIALFDTADAKTRVLTRGGGDALEPTWLNDGRHLVYTAGKGKERGLVLLDSESGRSTQLHELGRGRVYQPHFVYAEPWAGR